MSTSCMVFRRNWAVRSLDRGLEGQRAGRTEGWKDRGLEGQRAGRTEGWKDRGLEGQRIGRTEGWKDRGLEGKAGRGAAARRGCGTLDRGGAAEEDGIGRIGRQSLWCFMTAAFRISGMSARSRAMCLAGGRCRSCLQTTVRFKIFFLERESVKIGACETAAASSGGGHGQRDPGAGCILCRQVRCR